MTVYLIQIMLIQMGTIHMELFILIKQVELLKIVLLLIALQMHQMIMGMEVHFIAQLQVVFSLIVTLKIVVLDSLLMVIHMVELFILIKQVEIFKNCEFLNSMLMSKYDSYGGALYLSSETDSFEDCNFLNSNSPFSIIDGGAIYTKSMKLNSVNVIFNNSLIYSNAKNAIGGAVSIEKSNGNFHNCIFINNRAETRLNQFDSTEGEPRSLGGAVSLISSTLNFTECDFINNIGIGISTKFESYGK